MNPSCVVAGPSFNIRHRQASKSPSVRDPGSWPTICVLLIRALCGLLSLATVAAAAESGAGGVTNAPGRPDRGYAYVHDTVASIPWSIHIFKISLARRDLAFTTTLGGSNLLGMSTVAEQLKAFPAGLGTPLAAVNGDFYVNEPEPLGDPRDLQIRDGELISAPAGHACFWIDPEGRPQSTNVFSRLRVRWPDGSRELFGPLAADRYHPLRQGEGRAISAPSPR